MCKVCVSIVLVRPASSGHRDWIGHSIQYKTAPREPSSSSALKGRKHSEKVLFINKWSATKLYLPVSWSVKKKHRVQQVQYY